MRNIIILLVALIGFSAQAQNTKNKNAKHTFEVYGNCETCKKRIEKAAYGVPGVKSANWDIESHQLSVILNEEKNPVAAVEKAVAAVGHDTDDIKSDEDTYKKLHGCCQYERKP